MSFPVSGRSRARRWVALVTATALAAAGLLIPTAAVAAQDTLALELSVTRPAVGDDGVYRIYEGGEIEILVKATNLADFNPMMIYDMSKVHVSGAESGSIFPSRGDTPDTMSFSFSPRGVGEATLTLDAGALYGLFDFAMSEPTSITVTVGRNATEAGTEIVRSLPVDQQARIALPAAGVGSQTVTTVSGDLPPGIALNDHGTALEGTPTVNGTYVFSVKRASLEKVRTDPFRITVGTPASLAPSSVDVVAAVGSTATVDLGVGGDAVEASIDVSPEARPFVSLDWVDARLVLSYIVQDHDEPVSVAVTASNEFGSNATETITFRRGVVPMMNTAGSVVNLNLGENYSRTFTVTGADSVRMSQNVPGLTLERSSDTEWTVSGVAPEGEFSYKLIATNVIGSVQTEDHVLRVKSAPVVTTSNELTVRTGSYTGTSLDATGFPAPTFELLSSVDDFALTQQDGSWWVGGRGATVGTHELRFRVWNEVESIEWVLTLTVVPGVPEILSGDQSTYRAGEDVHFQVSTRGEPTIALSFDNLPDGLTALDRGDGTGVITGTVTTPGTYPIDIKAQNEYGEDTQTLTLTFTQRPAFTSAPLATFTKGKDGAFTVQATGFPTPELSVEGALPEGLTFVDNGDGTASLAGTPSAAGTVKVTLIADNEPPAPMSLMARAMDPVEPVTQELTIVVADNATGTPDPVESTDPPVKPGPDAKPARTLPATGVDGSVGMAVGGGIAALIAGLVLVALRRRRAS